MLMQPLSYRSAVPDDEAGILKVFEEVAPEVPTIFDSGTKGLVQGLVESGLSWVVVDANGNVIGYALAEWRPDGKTLSLAYLGVSKTARNQRVSRSLVSRLQEDGSPIITDVRHNNKSSMVERFERMGFIKCTPDVFSQERTKLRWEVPAIEDNPPA